LSSACRRLGRQEHDLIGSIVAESFADDPVNQWAFNGTAAMRPAFTAMARHCYLKRGFGHVTTDGLAGTLWLSPGDCKDYGLMGNLALASAILTHSGTTALRRGMALDKALFGKHPGTPHYYLFAIAVDPSLQGRGVGSQLMEEALATIDAAHMPAFLENSKPRNTPFYERHGFRVIEEIVPAPGCPPMWLMWRDAR
jgi:ribosomal protein S18 acetylase RimI-like enzyme